MKNYIVTLIYICAILVNMPAGNLYSAEVADKSSVVFEYKAMDNRDPFIPLVTKDGKVTYGYSTIKAIADLKLEGIVFDPKAGSVAVINGSVLRENESLENIKLLKIEKNRIKILFNQKEYTVNLNEE